MSQMWSGRKRGINSGPDVIDLWRREVGDLKPRAFTNLTNASEGFILRLKIHKKLKKHRGCVNTVSFNEKGDVLISGSDDRKVLLWDWDSGIQKLAFHSGHSNNVFQAKFMPFTDDRTIITCAADGEVRCGQIADGGRVDIRLLAHHDGRVHKIAIEHGSSHVFYSCGEDGRVLCFDLRREHAMNLFTCVSLQSCHHPRITVCLNAISVDPRDTNFFAIAGSDEFVRLYDVRKFERSNGVCYRDGPIDCFCPPTLLGNADLGITGLAFSDQSELLASYADENIYLFPKEKGLGPDPLSLSPSLGEADSVIKENFVSELEDSGLTDMDDGFGPQAYGGHRNCDTTKGVGFFGPNCEYVVSGSDCGRIFIWRKKDGLLLRAMDGDKFVVNCIESHPHVMVLASSGIEDDIKMWVPNATEHSPRGHMDEICNAHSSLMYYYEPTDEDEDDDTDEEPVDNDEYDYISDAILGGTDSLDDDDSDSSGGDLDLSDDCINGHLSDHYLASGHVDDAL